MTPKPKKSRARFVTVDDIEAAAERLQGCVDQIKGLVAAMRDAKSDDILKVDGGDQIVDAVQLATAWYYKVEGLYRVRRVAAAMNFPHDAPASLGEPKNHKKTKK